LQEISENDAKGAISTSRIRKSVVFSTNFGLAMTPPLFIHQKPNNPELIEKRKLL